MNNLSFVVGLALLCVFGVNAVEEEADYNIPVIGGKIGITDEQKLNDLKNNFTVHLQKLGAQENGSFELIRLHSATYQVVAGILHEGLVEIKENDRLCNCTISLWEKPWEDFVKLNVECGPEKRKYEYVSGPKTDEPVTPEIIAFGGFSAVAPEKLTDLHAKLTPAFTQLSAEREDFDLTIKRILDAKTQVVAGFRTLANIEATNKANEIKKCEVDILEKAGEKSMHVELRCEDGKNFKVVKQE